MTTGPMTRHLLAVAWPVSVSFLIQTMYNLVDAWWLGKLGKTAMGVAGAAAATVLSRGLASALALRELMGGKGFRLRARDLRWDGPMFRRLLRVGLPLSLGQTATAVGQNLGAGLPERAALSVRRSALLITAFLLPLTTLTYFFGGSLTHWFVADAEVVAYGRDLFRITSFSVFAFSLILVLFGAFQGAGRTVPVMVVNTGRLWAVRIPATLLLTRLTDLGPSGLWWAMNLSNLLAGAVAFIWFLRGDWKKPVIEPEPGETLPET